MACRQKSCDYSFAPYKMQLVRPLGNTRQGRTVPKPRSGHRCVANRNNLYCFGGFNPQLSPSSQRGADWSEVCPLFRELWKFNFATKCWTKLKISGTVPTKLASHSAVLSGNFLLTYGGTGVPFGESSSNKLFACNLKTLSWSEVEATGTPPIEQYGQAVTLVNDDLYVVGGTTGFDYTIEVHCLNLTTKAWKEFPPRSVTPTERYRHEIAKISDTIFLFGGGTASRCFSFKNIHCFNVPTRVWSMLLTNPDPTVYHHNPHKAGYPAPRRCHSLVRMDDCIFIYGGYNGTVIFSDVWRFNIVSHNWTRVSNRVPLPTYFHSAALTPSGCMYVYGGVHNIRQNLRTSDVYSIWLKIPKLKDICWDAVTHYYCDWINSSSKVSLLREGIPQEFVDQVEIQAECG